MNDATRGYVNGYLHLKTWRAIFPKFPSDDDMTAFLKRFEKAMLVHEFPKSAWTKLIPPQLVGKGQKVFAELSADSCMQYETLKTALLLAYARVPEFHRKRFRSLT